MDLVVFRQQPVHFFEVGCRACLSNAGNRFAAGLCIHRLAHHMQAMRDQRVFKFENLVLQGVNSRLCVIPFGL